MGRKWTDEEIEFLKENYQNMTYNEMGKKLSRSNRSIESKVRRLGLSKQEHKPQGYWTENRVIKKLQELAEKYGEDYLKSSNLNELEPIVYSRARKLFSSYKDALEKAGFNHDRIYEQKPSGYWTKEKVIQRLRKLAEEHGEEYLSSSKLRDENYALLNAANRMFGSLKDAVEKAGFDYSKALSGIRYWTKDRIVKKLRKLKGEYGKEYLSYENLQEKEASFLRATKKRFGSFDKALKEAGFDYEGLFGKKPWGYWTEERIIKKLQTLAEQYGEEYLSYSKLKEINPELHGAAINNFENLGEAVKEAGFDYNEIGKKPPGYWTEERIIKKLQTLAEQYGEEYLSHKNLKENEEELHPMIIKAFGSLKSGVEEAGFDYYEIVERKINYWTKEKITKKLKKLAEEHGEDYLHTMSLRRNEQDLLGATRKKFGSLRKAVENAGFDYTEICRTKPTGYWTEGRIIERLRELARKHGEEYLTYNNLAKKGEGGLIGAAERIFGSIGLAVEKAGFDYEKIIGQKPPGYWTKEKVIQRLRKLAEEHGKDYLRLHNIEFNQPRIRYPAKKLFGSYSTAVEEAGFDYENIKRPSFGGRARWYGWEECCREVSHQFFDSGEISFKEILGETRLRPDLQIPDEDLIVDAKLNAWDMESISKDIDNYLGYCDRLEFWCLDGERDIVPEDVGIVSSEELLERLEENGLSEEEIEEFEKKIELIRRGINPYEESQEEFEKLIQGNKKYMEMIGFGNDSSE